MYFIIDYDCVFFGFFQYVLRVIVWIILIDLRLLVSVLLQSFLEYICSLWYIVWLNILVVVFRIVDKRNVDFL